MVKDELIERFSIEHLDRKILNELVYMIYFEFKNV